MFEEDDEYVFDNLSLIPHNHNLVMFENNGGFFIIDFEDCANPQLI